MPERVPASLWAQLNRPVPLVKSAMVSAVRTPSVAPLMPSSAWMATRSVGFAVIAKNSARWHDAQPGEQERPTSPTVGGPAYPGCNRATMT